MAVLVPLTRLAEANSIDKRELEAAVEECMAIAKSQGQGQGTHSPSSSQAFPLGSGALGIGLDTSSGGGGGGGGGGSPTRSRRGILKKGGRSGSKSGREGRPKRASFGTYLQ